MKLPINCCCDPSRLLGFVDVPKGELLKDDDLVSFSTCSGNLQLPLGHISGLMATHPAIKSMDTPLATLRTIPGFEEYQGDPADKKAREERIKQELGAAYRVGETPAALIIPLILAQLERELLK